MSPYWSPLIFQTEFRNFYAKLVILNNKHRCEVKLYRKQHNQKSHDRNEIKSYIFIQNFKCALLGRRKGVKVGWVEAIKENKWGKKFFWNLLSCTLPVTKSQKSFVLRNVFTFTNFLKVLVLIIIILSCI